MALVLALAFLAGILAAYFLTNPHAPGTLDLLATQTRKKLGFPFSQPTDATAEAARGLASPSARGEDQLGDLSAAAQSTGFSNRLAYRHVVALGRDIGARPAGTLASVRAGEYIEAQLRDLGYRVSDQRFSFRYYEDLGTSLRIISPAPQTLQARALSYSAPGRVRGQLAAIGLGLRQDLEGIDLTGKIALVRAGDIPLGDKITNASDAGAQGIIVWNDQPVAFHSILPEPSKVPAIGISSEGGELLRKLAGNGPVEVEVSVDSVMEERLARNVIGDEDPASVPAILVTAHFDSAPVGSGAHDNASGVAVMLELARVMASEGLRGPVIFAAFGASEYGHLGSQRYLDSLSEEQRRRIALVLDLDALAAGGPLLFSPTNPSAEWAGDLAQEVAGATGIAAIRFALRDVGDNAPLAEAGLPCLVVHRATEIDFRPEDDHPDLVDRSKLEEAGRFVELLAKAALARLPR